MLGILINLVGFFLELLCFIILIRFFIPLKKINKIGVLNLILISAYIVLEIYYISNKLWQFPILPYYGYINLIIVLLMLYRLNKLNIEVNCNFKKCEKIFRYFHQNDKRWKNIAYGNSTIGKFGCGLAVLAMIESIVNTNINPEEVGKRITENFEITKGTSITVMAEYLNNIGFENTYLSRDANISSEMKNNNIICVNWQNSFVWLDKWLSKLFGAAQSHYVLLYDIKNNNAYVADPANYSRTIKAMPLKKLAKKVIRLNQIYPYISVSI